MIIQGLQAENILKYESLDLQGLPSQGVIAISGQNESGKSSIGETICFALFGRTFSLSQNNLSKLLRWGANRGSVTITFMEDGNSYILSRGLDIDGDQSAKLCRSNDQDNPIATGTVQVADTMFKLLGFGYDEFIESFYLAQREITSPHPHSQTLKTIAGLSALEKGADLVQQNLQEAREAIEQLKTERQRTRDELDSLAIDPKHLHRLQEQQKETAKAKQRLDAILGDYAACHKQYATDYPQLDRSRSMRKNLGIGLAISSVLMLFLFGCWLDVMFNPEIQSGWLSNLGKHLPGSMVWVAVPVLLLAFFVRDHNLKIKQLRKTGHQFATSIETICATPELLDLGIAPPQDLAEQTTANRIDEAEINQGMQATLSHLQDLQRQHEQTLQELVEPIRIEKERRDKADSLEKEIQGHAHRLDDLTKQNAAREIAIELLTGAGRHLSRKFNHTIREHVGMTLPLFTEGRYEHLEIDNEMTIQVFSSEKRGYLELDEISSGTQRQIMLAVRLALSQELANRRVKSKQFLILDEPFAFFDQERTLHSLAVLPELSDDLPQIFVTSQVFPAGSKFQQEIVCTRETKTLQ